jgi:hypothetical protein
MEEQKDTNFIKQTMESDETFVKLTKCIAGLTLIQDNLKTISSYPGVEEVQRTKNNRG